MPYCDGDINIVYDTIPGALMDNIPPLSHALTPLLSSDTAEKVSAKIRPQAKLSGDFRKKLDPIKLLFGKGSR